MSIGVSCTEIMISLHPPWIEEPIQRPALVPGVKTVVTAFQAGEEGVLDAEFKLGKNQMNGLLMKLAQEEKSFLTAVQEFLYFTSHLKLAIIVRFCIGSYESSGNGSKCCISS